MMTENTTIDSLLKAFYEDVQKKSKGRTAITYRKKIEVFINYLQKYAGLNDKCCRSCFVAVDENQIIDSVIYYVQESEIRYKATVDVYLSAIIVFFDFLHDNYKWRAELFVDSKQKNALRKRYNDKIKALGLFAKEQSQPLTEEEFRKLLQLCNEKINNAEYSELTKKEGYNGAYTYFISALATKIVMYTGIRNSVLAELKINAYDELSSTIIINGYQVHLPDELAQQMRKYEKIRRQLILETHETKLLLLNRNNPMRIVNNATMFYILPQITGTKKATGVAKYRILQMIEKNIPREIIKEFTGYSDEVLGHCQEMHDEIHNGTGMKSKIRILDSGLRGIENFEEL